LSCARELRGLNRVGGSARISNTLRRTEEFHLPPALTLVSCSAASSTLKMEAIGLLNINGNQVVISQNIILFITAAVKISDSFQYFI
jgi:hypothetical protein